MTLQDFHDPYKPYLAIASTVDLKYFSGFSYNCHARRKYRTANKKKKKTPTSASVRSLDFLLRLFPLGDV